MDNWGIPNNYRHTKIEAYLTRHQDMVLFHKTLNFRGKKIQVPFDLCTAKQLSTMFYHIILEAKLQEMETTAIRVVLDVSYARSPPHEQQKRLDLGILME